MNRESRNSHNSPAAEQIATTVHALEANQMRVYGQASAVNKVLIGQGEAVPGRIQIVLVKQLLGF